VKKGLKQTDSVLGINPFQNNALTTINGLDIVTSAENTIHEDKRFLKGFTV
jgi:hypothetical protein